MKRRFMNVCIGVAAVGLLLGGCASNNTVDVAETVTETTTAGTTAAAIEGAKEIESSKTGETQAKAQIDEVEQKKVYVSPEWVQSVIAGEQKESEDYIVLECSWGTLEDAAAYKEGHIKGAYHMNTDDIESEEYWNIRTPEEIKALMASYGITKDTTVICYNNSGENSADDRVAFTLLWAGVENVKSLDGGLDNWTKSGFETETTVNTPVASDREFGTTIPAHPEYVLSIDAVKEKLAKKDDSFHLVSIRSRDEFLGKTSGYGYIDKAGEPQGAIWGHDTDDGSYNNADGTMADLTVLQGILEESGASLDNELSFYCGTGWRATVPFLICYENGMTGMTLFDGGWYQWQMDDSLPVQVGDPREADCQYTTVGALTTDKAKK